MMDWNPVNVSVGLGRRDQGSGGGAQEFTEWRPGKGEVWMDCGDTGEGGERGRGYGGPEGGGGGIGFREEGEGGAVAWVMGGDDAA